MPTYEYACTDCGHQFEVVQSFSDDALTNCPECKGALRKVYGGVGIVFKGSGFYKNDSRGSSSSATPNSTTPPSAGTSSGGDSGASTPSTPSAPSAPSAPSSSSSSD